MQPQLGWDWGGGASGALSHPQAQEGSPPEMLGSAGHLYVPGAGLSGSWLACASRGCSLEPAGPLTWVCVWPLRASPQISLEPHPTRVGAAPSRCLGAPHGMEGVSGVFTHHPAGSSMWPTCSSSLPIPWPDLCAGAVHRLWPHLPALAVLACESPGMRGGKGDTPGEWAASIVLLRPLDTRLALTPGF